MQTKDKDTIQKEKGEAEVLKAIKSMPEPDRSIGKRLHAIISSTEPALISRTWYGMPAYTMRTENNGDKIVCFFRSRQKFGERFITLGFNDVAKLDEGNMWPIYFAITELTNAEEKKIVTLVKKAVG